MENRGKNRRSGILENGEKKRNRRKISVEKGKLFGVRLCALVSGAVEK